MSQSKSTFRIIALAAAGLLSLSLSACGGKDKTAHADAHDAEAGGHEEHGEDAHGGKAKEDPHAKDDAGHGADSHGHGEPEKHAAAKHGAADAHGKGGKHGAADAHGKGGKHGAAEAHGKGGQGGGGHGGAAKHGGPDASGLIEIDLGEFAVTQRREKSEMFLMIRFKIFGVIEYEQLAKFEKLLGERRQRMRENIITIVQSADDEQLCDPSLGALKSELVPAINKLLKTRLLKDVVFSDFAVLQN